MAITKLIPIIFLVALLFVVPISATTVQFKTTPATDGFLEQSTNAAYTVMRGGAGESVDNSTNPAKVMLGAGGCPEDDFLDRAAFSFNISTIPVGSIIDSAYLDIPGYSKKNELGSPAYTITKFSPATSGTLVAGDYDSFDNIPYSTYIQYANFDTNDRYGYNNWTMNSDGLSNITGAWFNVMVRDNWDVNNSFGGVCTNGGESGIGLYQADYSSGALAATLTVTYHSPTYASYSYNAPIIYNTGYMEGYVGEEGATWANLRNGSGINYRLSTLPEIRAFTLAASTNNYWRWLERGYVLMDTTRVPTNVTMNTATLSLVYYTDDSNGIAVPEIAITNWTPGNPAAVAGEDYNNVTSYILGSRYGTDSPAYATRINFPIAATDYIKPGSVTPFAIRTMNDTLDIPPVWSDTGTSNRKFFGNTTGFMPQLALDYTCTATSSTVANFSSNVSYGISAPVAFQFTDSSVCPATGWSWVYRNTTGNDTEISFSTSQNPEFTFGYGLWNVTLTATNAYGSSSLSKSFNISPLTQIGHPRLYYNAGNIAAVKSRMTDPSTVSLWNTINSAASTSPPLEVGDSGDTLIIALRTVPFAYAMTDDTALAAKAKTDLMTLCSYPSWETIYETIDPSGPIQYMTGSTTDIAAEAYDNLYNYMNESERQQVQQCIINKGLIPAYEDYTSGVWNYNNLSNRGVFAYGGSGVAAMAIYNDSPDINIPLYYNGMNNIMGYYYGSYDRNGASGEGIIYASYGLTEATGAVYYAEAQKNVFGINITSTYPNFVNTMNYPVWFMPPDKKSMSDSFNDARFNNYFAAPTSSWFTTTFNNGLSQWYYQNIPQETQVRTDVFTFLWKNTSVTPTAPTGVSYTFPDLGLSSLRSGFGTTNDLFAGFYSGKAVSNFTHYRPEQNSFMLDAYGERLIIEPGLSSSGYTDPNFESYYTATIGQNTILVNNNPMSQLNHLYTYYYWFPDIGRTINFSQSANMDLVTGDASAAYLGNLTMFNRTLAHVKTGNGYYVLYDDLAAGSSVEFDSLFHALGSSSISTTGQKIVITRPTATLTMTFISPSNFTSHLLAGQPQSINGTTNAATSYIEIHPTTTATTARYFAVLYPLPTGGSDPIITDSSNGTMLSATVIHNDIKDIITVDTTTGLMSLETGEEAPASITGLTNGTVTNDTIMWQWTNPTDIDFYQVIQYKNGTLYYNSSNTTTAITWTGLTNNTEYTISTHTIDLSGNMNSTWVNATATTNQFATPAPVVTPATGMTMIIQALSILGLLLVLGGVAGIIYSLWGISGRGGSSFSINATVLVASIITILVGAILLVISYAILSPLATIAGI